MGWMSHGVCFELAPHAEAHFASLTPPTSAGSTVVVAVPAGLGNVDLRDPAGFVVSVVQLPVCDPAEFVQWWSLSPADGALVAAAIGSVWALAFVWRSYRAALE